jgi:hypothetical protein
MTKKPARTATTNAWDWPGLGISSLIYFGLAFIYFLPAFLPGNHLYGSDYLAAGYFSHEFISEVLAAGSLPKWVPYVYGGTPWFANPGSTFYPFRLLLEPLLQPHRMFAAFYLIQFTLGGIGTYLLARELGTRRWVAFVGGVAFQFTGLMMSFVLAGHEGRIIVATMAPLFLFFLHRGVRTGALAWFGGAALTLGTALLSFQIQSNYYLLVLGAAWGVFAIRVTGIRGSRRISGRVVLGLGAVAAGFLMASINFLPFLGYVDQSPRADGGRGYEYATSWAMPPAEVTGLVLPEHAGVLEHYRGENPFKLHSEYVGMVVALLVLLGAWYSRRDRYWWFFLIAAVIGLTFSFGGHTPIYRLYYELLPGTARFRAPSISFFVVSMALVMMATLTLERLARLRDPEHPQRPHRTGRQGAKGTADPFGPATWILAGAMAVSLLVVVLAGGADGPYGRDLAQGALRMLVFAGLVAGTLWAWLRARIPAPAAALALAALALVDLWIVDRRFFEVVDAPAIMMAPDDVVNFLQQQPDPFRIWVLPGEVQGQQAYAGGLRNYPTLFGIHMAGGEHGNQLQRYNEFVGAGTVTYVDWHNFLADLQGMIDPAIPGAHARPNFLAAANIRYIVATVLLPGLQEAYRGRTGVVYEVPQALPRAYLVHHVVVAPEPDGALSALAAPDFDASRTAIVYRPLEAPLTGAPAPGATEAADAQVVASEPDRVIVRTRTTAPALLVLADNYYPGWKATVGDQPATVHRVNHTFRGVEVPAGDHEVVFRFRPAPFYAGAWISLLSTLALVGLVGAGLMRQRGRQGQQV